MSREIKFRVWDSRNSTMSTQIIEQSDWGDYLCNFGDYNADIADRSMIWLQFTGLLDKNGKEIYEGDLFDAWEGRSQYVVEWAENSAGLHLVWVSGDIGDSKIHHYFPVLMAQYQFKPIGNIYEQSPTVEPKADTTKVREG